MIESELAGLDYAGQTEQGHHFADATGTARVRVGNVTAVDSAGQRWPLPMEAEGGRLRVSVPETILAQANYPLAVDPWISPEFGMDQPVVTPAAFEQTAPNVAYNGSVHFAVWSQQVWSKSFFKWSIHGTRISGAGEVLDPEGFAVSPVTNYVGKPTITTASGKFFIAWEQEAINSGTGLAN